MEHLGKKAFLAVAQQPFEHVGESGFTNNFATLAPLLTTDGQALDRADFRHYGPVFWMVRHHALRFAETWSMLTRCWCWTTHPHLWSWCDGATWNGIPASACVLRATA